MSKEGFLYLLSRSSGARSRHRLHGSLAESLLACGRRVRIMATRRHARHVVHVRSRVAERGLVAAVSGHGVVASILVPGGTARAGRLHCCHANSATSECAAGPHILLIGVPGGILHDQLRSHA